jgi:hypothetical protein
MNQDSILYKALCAEFYELDKPFAPKKRWNGIQNTLEKQREMAGRALY